MRQQLIDKKCSAYFIGCGHKYVYLYYIKMIRNIISHNSKAWYQIDMIQMNQKKKEKNKANK